MTVIPPGWYVPTSGWSGPRWLLGQIGDLVRYSTGVHHRMCKARTFRRWASHHDAQRKSMT